jgi:molecular chaperone DnaJ
VAAAAPQREWFEKDYYKALGVPKTATEAEIRRAYRKLAKQFHPDANPGGPNAGKDDRFKEVSAAYDVLSDPEKRKAYDEVRRLGPAGAGFGGNGPAGRPGAGGAAGAPGGFSFTTDNLGDLGDMLGGLFGRGRAGGSPFGAGGAGGAGRAASSNARRGDDYETELHLSFLDAVNGATTTVNLTSEATCSTCHGTGAAPGTSPVVCPRCSGRGVLDDNQGLFSFSRACPECGGRGMKVETPCPTCHGTGSEVRPRQVKVRIPAGVDEGQRIRLKGKGGSGGINGTPGDLFVTVHVSPHTLFGRRGRDLTLTVPIAFTEAVLGADITVPTLEGPVVLRVPAGTKSGRTFRVKGKGVVGAKSVGDLLVTVEVAVPTKLSAAERDAVEALAEASKESPRSHLGV